MVCPAWKLYHGNHSYPNTVKFFKKNAHKELGEDCLWPLAQFYYLGTSNKGKCNVFWGCHNKRPRTGWLRQQDSFLTILEASSSWPRGRLVWFLLRVFFSLAYRWLSCGCVLTRPFHCNSGVSWYVQIPSSYKGTGQIGFRCFLMPHFNLITPVEALSLTIVTFWRTEG